MIIRADKAVSWFHDISGSESENPPAKAPRPQSQQKLVPELGVFASLREIFPVLSCTFCG